MKPMKSEENLVEFLTFLFQNTYGHFHPCIAQSADAIALHFGKRVDTPHNHTAHSTADYEVGTWRCLAIVAAWLKADIECGLGYEVLVPGLNRGEGIDLGMAFTTAYMIAFTDDGAVGCYDDGTHHRVGSCILPAVLSQLNAAEHVSFVGIQYTLQISFVSIQTTYQISFVGIYFTSQISLVSSSSAKVWYFFCAFTSSICAVTQSS